MEWPAEDEEAAAADAQQFHQAWRTRFIITLVTEDKKTLLPVITLNLVKSFRYKLSHFSGFKPL